VPSWDGEYEGVFEERVRCGVAERGLERQQQEVELAALECGDEVERLGFMELQPKGGVGAAERGQHCGQQERRHGRDDAQAQGAGERLAQAARRRVKLLHRSENPARAPENLAAGRRHQHRFAPALEELELEEFFELPHLGAEPGLGDVAGVGGGLKAPVVVYCCDVLELANRCHKENLLVIK
jgi:hypothetical protein